MENERFIFTASFEVIGATEEEIETLYQKILEIAKEMKLEVQGGFDETGECPQ
jgi:ribosomal protein S10